MAFEPILDNQINFNPLTDQEILALWTVDELDMLHDISGLGPDWQNSERRARLKKLETEDLEIVQNIIGEISISKEDL